MKALIDDMKRCVGAMEKIAFEMPPPNSFTPRFVALANVMRDQITAAEKRRNASVDYGIGDGLDGHWTT